DECTAPENSAITIASCSAATPSRSSSVSSNLETSQFGEHLRATSRRWQPCHIPRPYPVSFLEMEEGHDHMGVARVSSPMSNPAASFEPYRQRLLGLAYRMLGSVADAEDAVQDTYLRWHAADRDNVSDPRAFLMTTTTRICLDMLTSARARREEYVGPWLPEPVVDTAALAPDSRTELAEDLSIALLLTLDRL